MNKKTMWIVIIVIILIVLGIWYWNSSMHSTSVTAPVSTTVTPTSLETPTPATTVSGTAGINGGAGQTNTGQVSVTPVVKTSSKSSLGTFLVASNGMTLYRYTKDSANVSNCSGACSVNWPAYVISSNEPLVAGDGISGKLSTITRSDGTQQLTYNGIPLYFWKNDAKVGDTTGQNIGGVWFVVKP